MEETQITKGEQTRQEILASAKRLFLSQGFTATPMREIAHEVGITPGAIYNHYSGKDELFTAVLHESAPFDEVFALWNNMEADSVENMVRQMFRASLAYATDHQHYLQLALIDAQERDGVALASLLPEVLPRTQMWYQRLVALDAGTDQARLRDVPFLVFVRTLLSLVVGFMLTQRVATQDRVPHMADIDWAEALADLFLYGVLRPPARDVEGAAGT